MPEFGLVNMNGRLYDPVLGRFLSCDNYVQMPDNTQNFNRYSYCLNNPLKYNDLSGELFGWDDVIVIAATFAINYVSTSVANKDWGWSSVGKAALNTAFDYFTYGGSAPFAHIGKYAFNTAAQHFMPSFSIPVSDNFSITCSSSLFLGNNGFSGGINMSYNYKYNKDLTFSIGGGVGKNYTSSFVGVKYKDFGISHGITNYQPTTYNGVEIGAQTVGTYSMNIGKFSLSVSNDNNLFTHYKDEDGHDYDRWRSSAVELSYAGYSIGTYVLNNDGRKSSNGVFDPDPGYEKEKKQKSTWVNGQTYLAPLYIGYNDGGITHRLGYSGRFVQHYTQNCVHDIIKCPKFKGYDNLYRGIFSQRCISNSNYLWGF